MLDRHPVADGARGCARHRLVRGSLDDRPGAAHGDQAGRTRRRPSRRPVRNRHGGHGRPARREDTVGCSRSAGHLVRHRGRASRALGCQRRPEFLTDEEVAAAEQAEGGGAGPEHARRRCRAGRRRCLQRRLQFDSEDRQAHIQNHRSAGRPHSADGGRARARVVAWRLRRRAWRPWPGRCGTGRRRSTWSAGGELAADAAVAADGAATTIPSRSRRSPRCLGVTLPFLPLNTAFAQGTVMRIVQSPKSVSIYLEDDHAGGGNRIVNIDGTPASTRQPQALSR